MGSLVEQGEQTKDVHDALESILCNEQSQLHVSYSMAITMRDHAAPNRDHAHRNS
jgi:hypothetical protein